MLIFFPGNILRANVRSVFLLHHRKAGKAPRPQLSIPEIPSQQGRTKTTSSTQRCPTFSGALFRCGHLSNTGRPKTNEPASKNVKTKYLLVTEKETNMKNRNNKKNSGLLFSKTEACGSIISFDFKVYVHLHFTTFYLAFFVQCSTF